MKVYRSLAEYEAGPHTVATIGTFDGVHIGHRVILNRIREAAREIGGESVLISFHPHPRLVLFPENNPLRLLQTLEEKIETLQKIGLDKLLLIPFTKEFSRTSSKAFIRDILVDTVKIEKIVIGYDHHFGKNRTGGIEELRKYAPLYGYSVEEIPPQAIDDANVSSTKIRRALLEGDIDTANRYLGYAYPLSGEVIEGEKLGRQLGYPTANLRPLDPHKLIPADGVYFVRVVLDNFRGFGMMSIGSKPTLGAHQRAYEVHIFDFDADIYGKIVKVAFLKWVRPQQKFESLEALIRAIDQDKQTCMQFLAAQNSNSH